MGAGGEGSRDQRGVGGTVVAYSARYRRGDNMTVRAMDDPIHPVQIEGFRRMSPAQKLQMVCDLYHAGIELRIAGLRMRHPDWPREELEREARRSLLHAGT